MQSMDHQLRDALNQIRELEDALGSEKNKGRKAFDETKRLSDQLHEVGSFNDKLKTVAMDAEN